MSHSQEIAEPLKNLAGLKTLGRLRDLFAHLHSQGCQRDKAGNRTLHFDQLASLVMVAMFNPIARSMRALSQVSDLKVAVHGGSGLRSGGGLGISEA